MTRTTVLGACLLGWAFLLLGDGTASGNDKVVSYQLVKVLTSKEAHSAPGEDTKSGKVTCDFTKADQDGGEIHITTYCWHDNGPHHPTYRLRWSFDRDITTLTKGQTFRIHIEGAREDSLGATCPVGRWRASCGVNVGGGCGREDMNWSDIAPFWLSDPECARRFPAGGGGMVEMALLNGYRNGPVSVVGERDDKGDDAGNSDFVVLAYDFEVKVPDADGKGTDFQIHSSSRSSSPVIDYIYKPRFEGEPPQPSGGGAGPGGGGTGGGTTGGGGTSKPFPADPSMDPTAQGYIEEWIHMAESIRNKAGGGPWSVNRYGLWEGPNVHSAYAPDGWETRYHSNRDSFVWQTMQLEHLESVYGGALLPLETYLRKRWKEGAGTSATLPPATEEPAASVSGTTVQAGVRRVKKGAAVEVPIYLVKASDISNMNFEVSYDSSIVQVQGDVQKGELAGSTMLMANSGSAGLIKFGFARTDGLSGTGVLAVMTFQAVGQPGSRSALNLRVTTVNATGGATPAVDVMPGAIEIEPEENFNEDDASQALAMSVDLMQKDLRLDIDKDGDVTSRDATLIQQKLLERHGR